MGAWIEIPITSSAAWTTIVAPLVGAWIEMHRYNHDFLNVMVAPLVGAWIEMACLFLNGMRIRSLPSWERGLK